MSTDVVVDSDRNPPKDASVHSVEEANRLKPTAARRIRVNNNLLSTVFSQESDSDPNAPIRTVKRCSYHKDLNSYEDIFGDPVSEPFAEHTALRCRFTPSPDTKQNLFGDSGPIPRLVPCIRPMPSAYDDTFDILFGVPELTPNPRRPYEEDTHCKLFGQPDLLERPLQVLQEDTQARLFGPPTQCITRVTSRSENTQLDLFGPPLPCKRSTKQVARSSLQLFAEVAEAPSKPVVLTRAAKINGASFEKLFGPPLEVSRPPPKEDTATRLFGTAVKAVSRSVETISNPITGEYGSRTPSPHTPPPLHAPPKSVSRVVSPITGLILAGPQAEEEKVLQKRRPLPLNWPKVNTITGDLLYYAEVSEAQLEEKEVMKLPGEEEEMEESLRRVNSPGRWVEQRDQPAADSTSLPLKGDSDKQTPNVNPINGMTSSLLAERSVGHHPLKHSRTTSTVTQLQSVLQPLRDFKDVEWLGS